jgi:hypothetical protein
MTTAADDSAVEDAFEALLAGRPVPEGAAGLAAFAGAVRATATQPGRPNAALAELLATGLLTAQPSPSTRTARPDGASPSRRASRIRRRRRIAMFFPALLAKLLSAGAVAKAATGAGAVVVALSGAGAAGVLPGPVQDTFATVVSTVTPLEPPTSDDTEADVAPVDGGEAPTDGTTEVAVPSDDAGTSGEGADGGLTLEKWEQGPSPEQSFGSWVSEGARHGYVDGQTISQWAHKRNAERGGENPVAPPTTVPSAEPVDRAEAGDRAGGAEVPTADHGGSQGRGGNGSHADNGSQGHAGNGSQGHAGNGEDGRGRN